MFNMQQNLYFKSWKYFLLICIDDHNSRLLYQIQASFFIQSGDHWMELSVRNLINILDFLLKNIGDELKKK